MPADYTRAPQDSQITKSLVFIFFRRSETGFGCKFGFRIRPKPFRVKANRSNAGGSHTG
jgi:hypothetical protein